MIKQLLIILLTTVLLSSCGQSEEERRYEQMKNLEHFQNLENGKVKYKKKQEQLLANLDEQVAGAWELLQHAEGFKLGRLQSTKEREVAAAQNYYDDFLALRNKVAADLDRNNRYISHDLRPFENKPREIAQYIKRNAFNRDFSSFYNICDPYPEADENVDVVRFAEYYHTVGIPGTVEYLSAMTIFTETYNNEGYALVSYQDPSQNQPKKMKFVKRHDGGWYLNSMNAE